MARPAGDIDPFLHGAQQRGGRMRAVPRCQRTYSSRTPTCLEHDVRRSTRCTRDCCFQLSCGAIIVYTYSTLTWNSLSKHRPNNYIVASERFDVMVLGVCSVRNRCICITFTAVAVSYGTNVCRYNWHSAGSLGWPFPALKYQYNFQIKYAEAILPNNTRKNCYGLKLPRC